LRLRDKLLKIADPRAGLSAKRHLGRALWPRRLVRLTPKLLQDEIEQSQFPEIANRYRVPDPGLTPRKFVDLPHWLTVNLNRVHELDLDFGPRRRVLDLGMGAGYFLYICQRLGHHVLGLDIDDPMFDELSSSLCVPRRVWRIEAFVPLPNLAAKFDVITAYLVCFNNHNRADVWGVAEWSFFLDDIARHLRHNGRLRLELTHERSYGFFTPELRRLFEKRGAVVNQHRAFFNPMRPAHG